MCAIGTSGYISILQLDQEHFSFVPYRREHKQHVVHLICSDAVTRAIAHLSRKYTAQKTSADAFALADFQLASIRQIVKIATRPLADHHSFKCSKCAPECELYESRSCELCTQFLDDLLLVADLVEYALVEQLDGKGE